MWKWQVKAKNGHFLGNTNSGDQNFLNPFIYHRDTSHYMVLKKICVTPSGPFAPTLTNVPVKVLSKTVTNNLLFMFTSLKPKSTAIEISFQSET